MQAFHYRFEESAGGKAASRIDAKLSSSNPLVNELYDKAKAQAKAQAEEQLKAFAQVNERISSIVWQPILSNS